MVPAKPRPRCQVPTLRRPPERSERDPRRIRRAEVSAYLKLLFTSEQMVQEHEIWEKAMEQKMPAFYEGPRPLSLMRHEDASVVLCDS